MNEATYKTANWWCSPAEWLQCWRGSRSRQFRFHLRRDPLIRRREPPEGGSAPRADCVRTRRPVAYLRFRCLSATACRPTLTGSESTKSPDLHAPTADLYYAKHHSVCHTLIWRLRRWLQPRNGYNYDSTSIRPRYDHSTTYVTTVRLPACAGCCAAD